MTEEWRPVPDGYGPYEVSSFGRVRNRAGHVLFQFVGTKGYPQAMLTRRRGERQVNTKVHRLVALAFLGPRPEGMTINHLDGVKTNNTASNLEYLTNAENIGHAVRMGRYAGWTRRPPRSGKKLAWEQVREIRRMVGSGETHSAAGLLFGVTRSTVGQIVNGKIWKEPPVDAAPQGETP